MLTTTQFFNTNYNIIFSLIKKNSLLGSFFVSTYIFIDTMKSEKLKNHVLEIFEEIKHDKQGELQLEGLSGAYCKTCKVSFETS